VQDLGLGPTVAWGDPLLKTKLLPVFFIKFPMKIDYCQQQWMTFSLEDKQ
jgi:hypothetical protein